MRPLTLMLAALALTVAQASPATVRYASPAGTDTAGLAPGRPGPHL